jgi:hypothetical protein
VPLQQHECVGAEEADEREVQKNIEWHPAPVRVPDVEQGEENAKPDPVKRDGAAARVAEEKKQCRSREPSGNAPPALVLDEKIAEMTGGCENDGGSFQPIGVVDRTDRAGHRRNILHVQPIV